MQAQARDEVAIIWREGGGVGGRGGGARLPGNRRSVLFTGRWPVEPGSNDSLH